MTEEAPGHGITGDAARPGFSGPAGDGAGPGFPDPAPDAVAPWAPSGREEAADSLGGPLAGAVTGATYGVLFLLGVVLGVVGGFEHSWYAGDLPVAAVGWLVILFAVPYAMGRLTGGKLGALVPAAGWLVSSFVLATPQAAGDLAIAGDPSGFCYLYGGAVAVALAVVATRSAGSWLLRRYGNA
ncbi:hypothetical protein JOL79_28235 [Microbispora sp. RL4-1S]|uniref:Uncharacterized protein n=1 Tax=Microbispora oryzae TaxID=2806554 RepID=A0A940WMK4_9ACTN|nr:DUF6113 family protein [Microbispora oryzae]MBP2707678.1 hypothetical protein [Microbispora oryzae]